jgi:ribosome-binding factor A
MSRIEKVSESLKKEISRIIHDELKDPRLGFITVTRATVSKDLRLSRVFYSVLGNPKQKKQTQKALERALGFIRHCLAERLNMRITPEIILQRDDSCEYSIRIQQELDRLKSSVVRKGDNEELKNRGTKGAKN